jgi:UDP-2-acetamido-3-amino-2,3-dideoxy-glucuronate N-acetyltransferase
MFTNDLFPRATNADGSQQTDADWTMVETFVKKGASIGANATIVCGHDIGEFAFIGAGAVVTKNVPAYALLVGNPARQLGWMSEYGHRLEFNQDGIAICPESGEKYQLKNQEVTKI